jgi:peptidoglycan hydrolase-like protein with peptidoglycan-binding domain
MKTRTAMKTWMTALALTAAGTMLATSAFAQTGAGNSPMSTGTDIKGGTDAKSGMAPASGSNSPSTSGSTGSEMKSGAMGGDVKSDAMKSGHSARSARGAGNSEQVKAVQQALKDKGHDTGDIDGRMGPKTQAALRDFQQKEGLKATGRADAETMAKLGVEAKTGAVDSSPSPSASPSGLSSPGSSSSTGAPSGAQSGASTGAKQAK